MQTNKVKRLAIGGVLTAVIAVLTAYVSVPIPGGYLNPGDAAVALAAAVLGPFAAIPAGLGSMIADLLVFPSYAVFTLIIKGLMGFIAGWGMRAGKLNVKSALSILAAGVVLVGGYFVADLILGDIGMGLADIPWNCIQLAIFVVFSIVFLVTGIKRLAGRG